MLTSNSVRGGQMKKRVLAAVFAAMCSGAIAQTASEILVVPPYPAATAWKKITDKADRNMLLREWIPADQTEDDIKDILTEQQFFNLNITPATFIKEMVSRVGSQCAGLRVNGPVEHIENGFAVAYAQLYCSRQKSADKDVDIFVKAIAGTRSFYDVQYEIRRPVDKNNTGGVIQFSGDQLEAAKAMLARQANANEYLTKQVKLCATVDASGACTPGTVTQLPKPAGSDPLGGTHRLADDVSADYGFTPGKTIAADVRQKFGKPITENRAPDGHSVLMFGAPEGNWRLLGCLFDPAGILIAIRLYRIE